MNIAADLGFFAIFSLVFSGYWLQSRNSRRLLWLTATSCLFFAAWDWRLLVLIAVQKTFDYFAAFRIEGSSPRRHGRPWLWASIMGNVTVLIICRQYGYFADSLSEFTGRLGLPLSHATLTIILPLAVAFYICQSMAYVLDVFRGHCKAARGVVGYAFSSSFFPQLISGHVVREADFETQLMEEKSLLRIDWRWTLMLFLAGYFKKACISDHITPFIEAFHRQPTGFSASSAWLTALLYVLQVFCDISGYTDMALACASMFGFQVRGVTDIGATKGGWGWFWESWLGGVGAWLRAHSYVGLNGERGAILFSYRHMFSGMLILSLWRGDSLNLGLCSSLLLATVGVHQLWRWRQKASAGIGAVVHWQEKTAKIFMLGIVTVALVPFRAQDARAALTILTKMLGNDHRLASQSLLDDRACLMLLTMILPVSFLPYMPRAKAFLRGIWRQSSIKAYVVGYSLAWTLAIVLKAPDFLPLLSLIG